MTDLAATASRGPQRKLDFSSQAAQARIRSRYGSEARFRFYGMAALAIAAAFLVVLIADILIRGIPAFTQHSLVTDVELKPDIIDPAGKRDPQALRGADYTALARDALFAAVPGIEGRQARRQLTDVLSSGAGDGLRELVIADPTIIGKSVKARLLLSDDADLYLKGTGTEISTRSNVRGIATPSATSGEVTILVAANDFADELVAIKRAMLARAGKLRLEADRLERAAATEQAERIAQFRAEATELQTRYDAPKIGEALDSRLPSLLIAINGG
ncbi:MAG: DUF3333 domain-containing protein, partial [Burkholderiales bacterium]